MALVISSATGAEGVANKSYSTLKLRLGGIVSF